MSRALIIIEGPVSRHRAHSWVEQAPEGTRVEFKKEKRTLEQNAKLWALLTDIASQKEHAGRKYPTEIWKTLFVHAWQKEVRMIPSLDGQGILPLLRTSDLSKEEMSELLEFIVAWGAENSVVFHDGEAKAA